MGPPCNMLEEGKPPCNANNPETGKRQRLANPNQREVQRRRGRHTRPLAGTVSVYSYYTYTPPPPPMLPCFFLPSRARHGVRGAPSL